MSKLLSTGASIEVTVKPNTRGPMVLCSSGSTDFLELDVVIDSPIITKPIPKETNFSLYFRISLPTDVGPTRILETSKKANGVTTVVFLMERKRQVNQQRLQLSLFSRVNRMIISVSWGGDYHKD